jgi:hypothetical protein
MHQQPESTNKTKSAGLLAAEAAFAPSRQTAEQQFSKSLPAVTVLRIEARTQETNAPLGHDASASALCAEPSAAAGHHRR